VKSARALVSQLDRIPLSSGLIDEAADAGQPILRSVDAIHLVSALSISANSVPLSHMTIARYCSPSSQASRPPSWCGDR
jgi:hypothetical protein